MANLAERYVCPVCDRGHDTLQEARICRNKHPCRKELWAVGSTGKEVKVNEWAAPNSMGSREWALEEAELSDFIKIREQQLAKRKEAQNEHPEKP